MKTLPRNLFRASITLFLISLALPAFWDESGAAPGALVFLVGAVGLFFGEPTAISWLANPLLFAAWGTFEKNVWVSFVLSVLAFIASVSFLGFDKIYVIDGASEIKFRFGYWVWLASTAVMMAGTGIQIMEERKK